MSVLKIVTVLLSVTAVTMGQPRVSRSFVRGFLVGYAKGLQEGKQTPVVHQVACAFHPVMPEPMMHHEVMHESPPPHMPYHPEPEHEQGGYSSNHVSHSSSSSGGHRGRGGSMDPHDEKKAAASSNSNTMIGQLQKLGLVGDGPMTPMLPRGGGHVIQARILTGASVNHDTKQLPPPSASTTTKLIAAPVAKVSDKNKDQPK